MKLKGVDTIGLTRELQAHGIRVQGSTIIGMEHQTPDSLEEEIAHAVAHDADCHQFMLFTPMPGTPIHNQVAGRVLLWSAQREAAAYPAGRPLEPRTFVDRRNWS